MSIRREESVYQTDELYLQLKNTRPGQNVRSIFTSVKQPPPAVIISLLQGITYALTAIR